MKYLALIIDEQQGLIATTLSVYDNNPQAIAEEWKQDTGEWPERIILLRNGSDHPEVEDDACVDIDGTLY